MSDVYQMHRWKVVAGALVIQISLGAVYIWSIFQTPLRLFFPEWTETQVTLPAKVVLAFFAFSVILGGRIQDSIGPRKVATYGGIILGIGLILSRFTEFFQSPTAALIWLTLTFSVIGGIGIGTAYVCPVATCVKWFPDKRGLITGLAVAGFGAGAFFFAPLAKGLILGVPYALFHFPLFSLPKIGVFNTFMALGAIFLTAVATGAQCLSNPPDGWSPAGWHSTAAAQNAVPKRDFGPTEMFRTQRFWLLWITYVFGCTAGLMLIMKASPIWQSLAIDRLPEPITSDTFAAVSASGATAVSILAIFNAAGRILWGKLSDVFGRRSTLSAIFMICGAALLLLNQISGFAPYLVCVCTVGFCFGGYLSLYPAMTADFFGARHIGVNYGWMFTAFGIGGIVGPYMAAAMMRYLRDVPYQSINGNGQTVEKIFELGSYSTPVYTAAAICFAAGILITQLRPPKGENK